MIEYRKGSLFDAPEGSILAHACNAQGVWGSGVAAEFRNRYPDEYRLYRMGLSFFRDRKEAVGKCLLACNVACLITSFDYGHRIDSESDILKATGEAFRHLMHQDAVFTEVHMPRINSGLFRVPWEKTEAVLNECLKIYPGVKIVVWEL